MEPVKCGCGGEAKVECANGYDPFAEKRKPNLWYGVICKKCKIQTKAYYTEAEAITAWNRAMGGTSAEPEREKGKWIYDTERVAGDGWTYSQYHCSECGFQELGGLANFCPHCGVKMTRGEDGKA